ncbi:phosphomethylpyrimidine synthase ThiC [Candidatus Peregrinibacteria bacterium]|nr:phosphomethylpyrimidine synthase ThiC [Candidatus Peregrinibacteria bacterium]
MSTQMIAAREGRITREMEIVAQKESLSVDILRQYIAEGSVIIPANTVHLKKKLDPIGIGKGLKTKVNVNFGASPQVASLDYELKKLEISEKYGADTVMDLSTKGDLDLIREAVIDYATMPVGTVPIYQVVEEKGLLGFDIPDILRVIRRQAEQGVDYMTIHAGFLREYIPLTKKRVVGVVSRGGGILGKWMEHHKRENPLYECFDEICAIFQKYDVSFSLGDSLRPGGLVDCGDEAQMSELSTLGELTKRAWKHGAQVMVEGPGHVPIHMIREQMEIEKKVCHGAPFYVLGPLIIDTGAGYDHITGAIGGAVAGMYGADMLCYVTPAEHLKLPDENDVKEGLIAFKIAARGADIAKGIPGAWEEQKEMSRHRKALRWEAQSRYVFDREKFYHYRIGSGYTGAACGMCGDEFCPMNEKIDMDNAFKEISTASQEGKVEKK